MKKIKAIVCWMLVIMMMMPAVSGGSVRAEENNTVIGDGIHLEDEVAGTSDIQFNNALEAFGFETNLPEKGETVLNDGVINPMGVDSLIPNPISELFIRDHEWQWLIGDEKRLQPIYDLLAKKEYMLEVGENGVDSYDGYMTVAGDFTGDGLDNQMITVAAITDNHGTRGDFTDDTFTSFDMYLQDPKRQSGMEDDEVFKYIKNGEIFGNVGGNDNPFDEAKNYLQNYLQITTGDYTGDGVDEIAVYIPERSNPRVIVYQLQLSSTEDINTEWNQRGNWEEIWTINLEYNSNIPNMVSLVSGDLNGDMIDELAVSWGYYSYPQYQLQNDWTGYNIDNTYGSWTPSRGKVFFGSREADALHKSVELDFRVDEDRTDGIPTKEDTYYDSNGNALLGIYRVSFAIGDADNDGVNELYVGGNKEADITNFVNGALGGKALHLPPYSTLINSRYLRRFDYMHNLDGFAMTAGLNQTVPPMGGETEITKYVLPYTKANMVVAHLNGVLEEGFIYLDSMLYQGSGEHLKMVERLDTSGLLAQAGYVSGSHRAISPYCEMFATAADINGAGEEVIFISQYIPYLNWAGSENFGEKKIQYITRKSLAGGYIAKTVERTLFNANSVNNGTEMRVYNITKLNTDYDSKRIEYTGEHYYSYNNPNILAVLASPPYFEDLENLEGGDSYIGNSQTSYGKSTEHSESILASHSISVGKYYTGSIGAGAAGTNVKIGGGIEASFDFTYDFEESKSKEYGFTFGALGGQDTVALFSTVEEIFGYKVTTYDYDGEEIVSYGYHHIPYDATLKVFSATEYDKIVADMDTNYLPKMEDNVLKHKLGDPESYIGLTSQYEKVNLAGEGPCSVGIGPLGYTTLSQADSSEKSYSYMFGGSTSVKSFGQVEVSLAVALEYEEGIFASYSGAGGFGLSDSEGNSFEGTVMGMPIGADTYGYGYDWNVFKGEYNPKKDPTTTYPTIFPVISYETSNVTRPPLLPKDFKQNYEQSGGNSIVLEWTSNDKDAIGYQVYRIEAFPDGEEGIPIGEMISVSDQQFYHEETNEWIYQCVDNNLMPNTNYSYKIQAIGKYHYKDSVLSGVISAMTKLENNHPEVILEASTLQLYPDRIGSLGVHVNNNDGFVSNTMYQWQKLIENKWVGVVNAVNQQIVFAKPEKADEGLYRCKVNQIVEGANATAYSELLSVVFDKHETEIDVSHNGSDIIFDVYNQTGTTGSLANGLLDYYFYNNGTLVYQCIGLDVENGKGISPHLNEIEEGVYSVQIDYREDNNLKKASVQKIFLVGVDQGYILQNPSEIIYGDDIRPSVYEVKDIGNGEIQVDQLIDGENNITIDYRIINGYHYKDYIYTGLLGMPYLPIDVFIQLVKETQNLSTEEALDYIKTVHGVDIHDGEKATATGKQFAYVEISQNGTVIGELFKDITVLKKKVFIQCPTARLSYGDASKIYDYDYRLKLVGSEFAYEDTIASLGLGVLIKKNNAIVSLYNEAQAIPGDYSTHVGNIETCSKKDFYEFEEIAGNVVLVGDYYSVTTTAVDYQGKKVGDVDVASPTGYTQSYPYNSTITFLAAPYEGYMVDYWEVNDVRVTDELINSNILTRKLKTDGLDVKVYFKRIENNVIYSGENGEVNCVTSDRLESGDRIINGATFTFEAVPDEGYHFVEWHVVENGTAYPVGTVSDEGMHQLEWTFGNKATSIIAVFERDQYEMELSEHLTVKYSIDDDHNPSTAEVFVSAEGIVMITGDQEVVIEASPGYVIDTAAYWVVDGEATEVMASSYSTTIVKDMTVSAQVIQENYDLVVAKEWQGTVSENQGNQLELYIDDVLQDNLQVQGVDGGATVRIVATSGYGMVLDQWIVNGAISENSMEYVCHNISGDLSVTAVFKDNVAYEITGIVGTHGSLEGRINAGEWFEITINTPLVVYKGDSVSFRATPDTDFMVRQWRVDGNNYTGSNKVLTIENISKNQVVEVEFQAMIYYDLEFIDMVGGLLKVSIDDGPLQAVTNTVFNSLGSGTIIKVYALPESLNMIDHWNIGQIGTNVTETVKNQYGTDFVGELYAFDLSGDTVIGAEFTSIKNYNVEITQPENGEMLWKVVDKATTESGISAIARDRCTVSFRATPNEGYIVTQLIVNGLVNEAGFDSYEVLENGDVIGTIHSLNGDVSVSAVVTQPVVPSTKSMTSYNPVTLTQTGDIANNNVQYQTASEVINALPSFMAITLEDGSTESVPVSWTDTDGYDATNAGNYTFTATWRTLPSGVDNEDNITAPICEVNVAYGAYTDADTPLLTNNLTDKTGQVGDTITLDATATVSDGGTISYQWYKVDDKSKSNPQELSVTTAVYAVYTSSQGISYYFCEVTNTNNSLTGNTVARVDSDVAKVTIYAVVPSTKSMTSYNPVTLTQTGDIANNNVQYQTASEVINALPSFMAITLEDGSIESVPVSWTDTDGYDATTAGNYTFTATWGTLPSGVDNEDNITAPTSELNVAKGSIGGGTSTPSITPTYQVVVSNIGTPSKTMSVNVDANAGRAEIDLGTLASNVFDDEGITIITMPTIPGVTDYTLKFPTGAQATSQGQSTLTFSTDVGMITMPDNMFSNIPDVEEKTPSITIGQGNKSALSDEEREAIGDKPLVQFTFNLDGEQVEWNNPDAPVSVSIPYTPTAIELLDPEHIVIWYIDGSGKVISVPSGRYNPTTGTVTFTTTHFSYYAIAYVNKTFDDLSNVEWARKSIEVMASKGIINGTSTTTYSPTENITRADYLVLLIKTLGLTSNFDSNFDDVKPSNYYYEALGIAKKLGIAEGIGDNLFNPKGNISRQDMIVMTAMALEKLQNLKTTRDTTVLDKFSDKGDISGYAIESLATMVKEGLISGSGDKLNPLAYSTRAEVAVFLYGIYNK